MLNKEEQIFLYYLRKAAAAYDAKWKSSLWELAEPYLIKAYGSDMAAFIDKSKEGIYKRYEQLIKLLVGEIEYITPNFPKQKVNFTDITDYNFDRNLSIIADAFQIPSDARPLFQLLVYFSKYTSISALASAGFDIHRNYIDLDGEDFYALGKMSNNMSPCQIRYLLEPDGLLIKAGVLSNENSMVELSYGIKKLLSQEFENTEQVIDAFIGPGMTTLFTANDFEHVKSDFDNIVKLLRNAANSNKSNINILLCADDCVHRKELVATACNAAGLRAYECRDTFHPSARYDELDEMQRKLQHSNDTVIVMDYMSDVFQLSRKYVDERMKITHVLRTNKRPIIWLAPNTSESNPELINDVLSLFSLVVRIAPANADTRHALIKNLLKKYEYEIHDAEILRFIEEATPNVPSEILEQAIKNAKITDDVHMIKYTLDKIYEYINWGRTKAKQ